MGDGEAPWQNLSPYRAMIKIVKEPSPTFGNPHVWSDDAFAFIEAATEKEAEDRSSCSELADMVFVSQQPNFEVLKPLLAHSAMGSAIVPETEDDNTAVTSENAEVDEADENFGGFASGQNTRAPTPEGDPDEGNFGFT